MSATPTYLTVPFSAKDRAKSLGARWDGARKQWFVPPGQDTEAFSQWIECTEPAPRRDDGEDGQTATGTPGIPLRDYLARVQQVVQQQLAAPTWVTAEITEAALRNGHLYLTLSQTDGHGGVIASVKAIAFSAQQRTWFREFTAAVGGTPATGMRVLAQVSARFDARYGFSLDLAAIDPAFTLGDFAQRIAKLRAQLQATGVYEQQRSLPMPTDLTRIAVVAPAGAAGLGDFEREARALVAAGLVQQQTYHATFQGNDTEASVCAAIARALADHASAPVDALILIRGGGSALDLAWLDAYGIAHAVATSPVPVWVGVGHERDRGLLDEVAHRAFDTPSKVAAHLVRTIVDAARGARDDLQRLTTLTQTRLSVLQQGQGAHWQRTTERAEAAIARRRTAVSEVNQRLQRHAHGHLTRVRDLTVARWDRLTQRAQARLARGRELVWQRFAAVTTPAQQRLTKAPARIAQHWQALTTHAQRRLDRWQHAVERFDLRVQAADPQRILARGFALVRDATGRVVRHADAAHGTVILRWHDGERAATMIPDRVASPASESP